jgi:hypothetical protein
MNRIEFGIFIKKTFDARYNQGRQEWRFNNGDRVYALDVAYESNRSTYEPHLCKVRLFERTGRTGTNAAEDIGRSSSGVQYLDAGTFEQDRMTRDELRAWMVKAVVTHEFEQC